MSERKLIDLTKPGAEAVRDFGPNDDLMDPEHDYIWGWVPKVGPPALGKDLDFSWMDEWRETRDDSLIPEGITMEPMMNTYEMRCERLADLLAPREDPEGYDCPECGHHIDPGGEQTG